MRRLLWEAALKRNFGLILGILSGTLVSSAWAAGYGLKEQSATAMGAAYAGVAADTSNPAAMSYNPTTLSGIAETDLAVSVVEIVPHSSAHYTTATTSAGTTAMG